MFCRISSSLFCSIALRSVSSRCFAISNAFFARTSASNERILLDDLACDERDPLDVRGFVVTLVVLAPARRSRDKPARNAPMSSSVITVVGICEFFDPDAAVKCVELRRDAIIVNCERVLNVDVTW